MLRGAIRFVAGTVLLALVAVPASGQSLRGSTASLDRQDRAAREHDFTFIDTGARLRHFAEQGWLVRVEPGEDFTLHAVSFPYARPELSLFIERLASQYRAACGEQLVVTSLTRPISRQPANASDRSVHPTGMAADLRYSWNRGCRSWLERVLVSLEAAGVLEATRERSPVHYHVAVFPKPYAAYVERLATESMDESEAAIHVVQPGDSLWKIAREYDTTVDAIRQTNRLRGSRIYRGQILDIPSGR
jgi:hypothetical protein